jgi:hypothetical protein
MQPFKIDTLLEHLKRAMIDRIVNNGFESKELYDVNALRKDMLDPDSINQFEDLRNIIKATGNTRVSNEFQINQQGMTNALAQYQDEEENKKIKTNKKELSPEEKQRRKNAEKAMQTLNAIAVKIPLLIFGAKLDNEEQGITIDNLTQNVDYDS